MSFVAMYPGECGLCGDEIESGEEVAYNVDDELCHEECIADSLVMDWQ